MKLKFADIVISVAPADSKGSFEISPESSHFLCQGQSDVALQVYCGQVPLLELGGLIFDSGHNWRLHRNDGDGVTFLCNRSGETIPFRLAVFAPDFLSGDVYMGEETDGALLPYPLRHPLGAVLLINLLSKGRGVLLHACGLSDSGRGTIFAGHGGAGKSTLATLWREQASVTLLNDERVVVRKQEGRFWVYGTPWYGSVRVVSPEAVPLERIFIIRHAGENKVVPLKPLDAASRLLACSFPTFWDTEGMAFTLAFLGQLSQAVPCYELGFMPDESVVDFVRCLT